MVFLQSTVARRAFEAIPVHAVYSAFPSVSSAEHKFVPPLCWYAYFMRNAILRGDNEKRQKTSEGALRRKYVTLAHKT